MDEFKESEQWGRFNNIKELSSAAINNVEISSMFFMWVTFPYHKFY